MAHEGDLIYFQDPAKSIDGIVALGGPLTTTNLLRAYCSGIFPWPINEHIVPWCCPEERGILEFKDLHISRSLARTRRKTTFDFTIDQSFLQVITSCAMVERKFESGTWITPQMIAAYNELHKAGHAHSVEVWEGTELVGGVYGVDGCGSFSGESMFTFRPNASKLALLYLIEHLKSRGLDWIDIQMLTPHMEAMGASTIPRDRFLGKLAATQQRKLVLFD
ncbi:MAG TPA: leucyl/phenylalanyl-tRNA--protein transferase [Pyrinomonadaceae bacterium]|jgi:leucyl/phenylalanyl-tRNA--protein transferase|nr:leucyl/phenylalanyl-tRNA--protein transferase [Pyrinomonadaceae bacterium]